MFCTDVEVLATMFVCRVLSVCEQFMSNFVLLLFIKVISCKKLALLEGLKVREEVHCRS